MVFRIFNAFLNNEKVIQELSQSPPIKMAAKAIVRGMARGEEQLDKLEIGKKVNRFRTIYREEFDKAVNDKKLGK